MPVQPYSLTTYMHGKLLSLNRWCDIRGEDRVDTHKEWGQGHPAQQFLESTAKEDATPSPQ